MNFGKVYDDPSKRNLHSPNMTLTKKPTTKPICIRRLEGEKLVSATAQANQDLTHENITLGTGSTSVPSSQKTAGFCERMKKNGIRGKKNPMSTP